jgi:hypothetical protein
MYAVEDPGHLPGFTSAGLDINEDGVVVGVLTPPAGSITRAFVWNRTLTDLPGLGYAAEARSIGDGGIIVGAAETNPGRLAAVVWPPTGSISRLAEPADAAISFTHGIDAGGRVAGGYIAGGREIPLIWPNAGSPLAAPLAATMPQGAVWSEALDVRAGVACGTTFDGQRQRAFVWDTGTGTVTLLDGESAVAFAGSDIVGTAHGQPSLWTGGVGAAAVLPGLAGLAQGVADGGTGADEVVGTVSAFSLSGTERPFLRRRFRRDELDPAAGVLKPRFLQLPAPETIDLDTLLPPGSGWTLLTASAINSRGQITGTGRIGGEVRAYRLSPPTFSSPIRLLRLAELIALIGGVAADGGGFGITADGHIIPIPPREPSLMTAEDLRERIASILRELAARAAKGAEEETFRQVLEAVVEEAAQILG